MSQPLPIVANVDKADHKKLGAWFLGPKAENEKEFLELIAIALKGHSDWRRSYFPTDPPYVTDDVKNTPQYQEQMLRIKQELATLNKYMHNSIPSFSSRYKGHMNWEVSMIGLLGYFASMLYNQNNVATEASSVTTAIEQLVGNDLCKMLQFRSHVDGISKEVSTPTAWGHLTSCGSVANFEATWAARNVKYLAYSVWKAIDKYKHSAQNLPAHSTLPDLPALEALEVVQANGTKVLLSTLNPADTDKLWILLNIPAQSSLDLLYAYADVLKSLDKALSNVREFGPQWSGMRNVPGEVPVYLVPATAHYSWAKGGALLGLGEQQLTRIQVDSVGRMHVGYAPDTDVGKLRGKLLDLIERKIPVMMVVGVMGSTTEGAMDPYKDIADLRDELRSTKNFDFYLHADAAWGGYCCSLLDPPTSSDTRGSFVPSTPLSPYVHTQLANMYRGDSITLDPHKAGYIQYPAGSICFQDIRMREMLAYKAPYIIPSAGTDAKDPSVGTYGIDGSRAGAAAVATFLHHRVTGLNQQGHGMLLGQANFNTKILWAVLATMAGVDDPFKIAQIQQPRDEDLPLLREALTLQIDELVYHPKILQVLQTYGPDFLINDFAINYSYPVLVYDNDKRTENTTVQGSVNLMGAIGDQLNTPYVQVIYDTTRPKGVSRKSLFVIRDTLYTETYSEAITALTTALGLKPTADDKTYQILVSTNMEPWTLAKGFQKVFQAELRQSILRAIGQLHDTPKTHSFVIVDAVDAEVFGEHVASFYDPTYNYQTIVKFQFGVLDTNTGVVQPNESAKYQLLQLYRDHLAKASNYQVSSIPLVLTTTATQNMNSFLYRADNDLWFDVNATVGVGGTLLGTYKVRVSDVLLNNHFDPAATYPANERYFLFGAGGHVYASHLVHTKPDYQHLIKLQTSPQGVSALLLDLGVEITLVGVVSSDHVTNPLQVGFTYATDFVRENAEDFSSTLTVAQSVYFDSDHLNKKDTAAHEKAKPHQQVASSHHHHGH